MKSITWIQPYYDLILNKVPVRSKKILDIGTGSGVFGFILKKTRDVWLTGIEPFGYELSHYDELHKMTWERFLECKLFHEKFDCVVCTEMIEHLPRPQSIELLDKAKAFGKRVIIATPYEFEEQEAYDNNPFQVHKSVITIDEFLERGYNVHLIASMTFKGITIRLSLHHKLKPLMNIIGAKITNIIGVYDETKT